MFVLCWKDRRSKSVVKLFLVYQRMLTCPIDYFYQSTPKKPTKLNFSNSNSKLFAIACNTIQINAFLGTTDSKSLLSSLDKFSLFWTKVQCYPFSTILLLPCDSVSIKLQELQQLICLLSVSCLFFSCQGIVGHEQRMCSTSCTNKSTPRTIWKRQIFPSLYSTLKRTKITFCLQLQLFLSSPCVMVIFCQLFCHWL